MTQSPNIDNLAGKWTYRSFISNPDLKVQFNDLEFGRGTITINKSPMGTIDGAIGGPGWSLILSGSLNYGDPYSLRFQGKGTVGKEEWVYDYIWIRRKALAEWCEPGTGHCGVGN